MGLDCEKCSGERELPAWYVDDEKKTVNFYYNLCPCTGKTDHRPGEREVTEEEHDRLKLEWAKKPASPDLSFQAAA